MSDDPGGIIAFVKARLDEDEAAANAGARRVGMPWRAEPQADTPGGLVIDELGLVGSTGGRYAAEHIARHDPARVLREIAAKRAIVDAYQQGRDLLADNRQSWDLVRAAVGAQRVVVHQLAAIWSDHPDYRQEWAP